MQLSRLSGRKVNEYLRKNGNIWRGKTMTIRWLPKPPRHPNIDRSKPAVYVGSAASTKLHKSAVKRNRMRRRCREALRIVLKEHQKLPTMQLLLSPKIASLDCDFEMIERDVKSFLAIVDR